MKNGTLLARLGHASAGIRLVWRRETIFRTHAVCAGAALGACALLRASPVWWAIVVLCIFMVFALEAMNSALEYLADRLHPQIHAEIGCAKDAAAGAVLLAGMGAALTGAIMVLSLWPA